MSSEGPRVVVIGAGWNGISAAKTYLQIDPKINLTILESESTLGGTWSADRVYPELLTQQGYGQYEAADFPLEQRDPDQPGGYIPSKRIHTYLKEYAEAWHLTDKIRYNTTVEHVRRVSNGLWELHLKNEEAPLICDKLIVATGFTSQPNIPDIPSLNFSPLTFHSKYLGRHHDMLRSPDVHTVTIYGGGKSAYDAANAALRADKNVQWIIRTSGEGMGAMVDANELKSAGDAPYAPVAATLQPDPLNLGWAYRFFHSGRNPLGYWLNWKLWDLITKRTLGIWGYDNNENMRKLKPNHVDHAMYWTIPAPFPVPEMGLIDRIRSGEGVTIYRSDIKQLKDKSIELADGTTLETDILIYATGYNPQESIFSIEDAYKLGLPVPLDRLSDLKVDLETYDRRNKEMDEEVLRRFPRLAQSPTTPKPITHTQYRLYRCIVPLSLLEKQDRSLAFVGYLQGTSVSLIADISSFWAAAWLSGQLDITRDKNEIEWEVDYLNAFMRNRYGNRGAVMPVALLEWVSCTKAMLRELDVPLPNVSQFKPWPPKVYRGLVETWKENRDKNDKNRPS